MSTSRIVVTGIGASSPIGATAPESWEALLEGASGTRTLEHEWVELSGRGRIWSFVIPHPPLLPAYTPLAPFNVIAVELDEDPSLRLIGNLVKSAGGEINEVDPHSIKIGEPVRVVFTRVDDVHLPRWVRA